MAKTKVGLPKGTRDLLPLDLVPRHHVQQVMAHTFQSYGFEPLETPAFERIETLTGKYGEEGEQLIFKILKRGAKAATGEADLALRYDLTVPLARVMAMYGNKIPQPFKRYQIQPVWRADRPQKGRFRQFTQCDVDVVGSSSAVVEIELLTMIDGVFRQLGFEDHVVKVNHRQVLSGLIRVAGIPADQDVTTIIALDKLDKVGEEGVIKELGERGIDSEAVARLLPTLQPRGTASECLTWLAEHLAEDAQGMEGVANLQEIFQGLRNAGVSEQNVRFDAFLARGLSYYTGAVFETVVPGFGGSLGGGGRYDTLIGMFSGRDIPACGTSFGLDRIMTVMDDRGMLAVGKSSVEVLVALHSADLQDEAVSVAAELRRGGLKVDLYPDSKKLGKQFSYAEKRGIAFVALVGPDEKAAGTVTLKNLADRSQVTIPRGQLLSLVKDSLGK